MTSGILLFARNQVAAARLQKQREEGKLQKKYLEMCIRDRRRGEEQKLVDLYHTQLEDYAQALHRMTGRRVKEKYIYSFTLKKEILLG